MLSTLLEDIVDRLSEVSGLTVLTDIRQAQKSSSPAAVVIFDSQSPLDDNFKNSVKYKVKLNVKIELFASSNSSLLSLIESIEDSLKISDKIDGTFEMDYSGWTIYDTPTGSDVYGAVINFAVVYIRGTS
jgi:hypothetical protein